VLWSFSTHWWCYEAELGPSPFHDLSAFAKFYTRLTMQQSHISCINHSKLPYALVGLLHLNMLIVGHETQVYMKPGTLVFLPFFQTQNTGLWKKPKPGITQIQVSNRVWGSCVLCTVVTWTIMHWTAYIITESKMHMQWSNTNKQSTVHALENQQHKHQYVSL